MIKKIQKHGNSKSIILDKDLRKKANINDYVEIEVKRNKIILKSPNEDDIKKFKELTKGA